MTEKSVRHDEALASLKEMIKPGDNVYTVLRHVSRSGMFRRISLFAIVDGSPRCLDWHAENLGVAKRRNRDNGLGVGGCGMDMGFHLVYALGRAMFPDGVPCTGANSPAGRCNSNDHSNGDRVYRSDKIHSDGGYAFKQIWM